jgi:hypothetical protein
MCKRMLGTRQLVLIGAKQPPADEGHYLTARRAGAGRPLGQVDPGRVMPDS